MRRFYYNYLSKIKYRIRNRKQKNGIKTKLKICVLFYIPLNQGVKSKTWRDGFTKGIGILTDDFDITWFNIDEFKPTAEQLNNFDFIIAKTGWHAPVDVFLRGLKSLKCPRGIVVSCSNPIKEDFVLFFYDVLWFQTFYYEKFIEKHPRKYHAYGANLKDFKDYKWDSSTEKIYDVMSIGIFESYKRFEKLFSYPGKKKLIIGNTKTAYFETIKDHLEESNIDVLDYVPQNDLTKYLDISKCLYMPSHINGGGERIVMEFKKSGIPMFVEEDNPKLQELLYGPDWDERSYAEGIRRGLNDYFNLRKKSIANLLLPNRLLKTGKYSFKNGNLSIKGEGFVEIGSFCTIGENTQIFTTEVDTSDTVKNNYLDVNSPQINHTYKHSNISKQKDRRNPVIIGSDVWIGKNVTILSGVKIGHGAYIEDWSIIAEDVEPFAVVGGSPSKAIKQRFSDEIIQKLLEAQWWDWSDEKILTNKDFFMSNLNINFPSYL